MGTKTKRTKSPRIPEPSPRFITWSAAVAAVLLVGIVTVDYAEGWTGPATTASAPGGAKH
jgi:hypothetical protein